MPPLWLSHIHTRRSVSAQICIHHTLIHTKEMKKKKKARPGSLEWELWVVRLVLEDVEQ